MPFWVIEIKNEENLGFGQLKRVHKLGRYDSKQDAEARQLSLGAEKRHIYEDRSLPGEVRKRAMETTYAVWTDKEIEDAQRLGTNVS